MKDEGDRAAGHTRPDLVRDVLVFQFKLIVDGFRDLLLVPVSIGAGLMSLIHPGSRPGPQFYDLLRVGRKSEQWINLFSAADRHPADDPAAEGKPHGAAPADIDDLVARVESFIVAEYRNGEITGQARQRLDRALESLRARRVDRNDL